MRQRAKQTTARTCVLVALLSWVADTRPPSAEYGRILAMSGSASSHPIVAWSPPAWARDGGGKIAQGRVRTARSFDSRVRRFASVGSPAAHARRRARSIAIVRLALMLNTPSGLFAPLGPNESDVASGSSPPAARGSERILRARRRRHVRRTRRSLRVNDPTHTHCARPNDRSHAARTGWRRARTRDRTGTTNSKDDEAEDCTSGGTR